MDKVLAVRSSAHAAVSSHEARKLVQLAQSTCCPVQSCYMLISQRVQVNPQEVARAEPHHECAVCCSSVDCPAATVASLVQEVAKISATPSDTLAQVAHPREGETHRRERGDRGDGRTDVNANAKEKGETSSGKDVHGDGNEGKTDNVSGSAATATESDYFDQDLKVVTWHELGKEHLLGLEVALHEDIKTWDILILQEVANTFDAAEHVIV